MSSKKLDPNLDPDTKLEKACIGISMSRSEKGLRAWEKIAIQALNDGACPNLQLPRGGYIDENNIHPFEIFFDYKCPTALQMVIDNPKWEPCQLSRGALRSMPIMDMVWNQDFETAMKIIDHPKFNPEAVFGPSSLLYFALSNCGGKNKAKWGKLAFKIMCHKACSKEHRQQALSYGIRRIKDAHLLRFFGKYLPQKESQRG